MRGVSLRKDLETVAIFVRIAEDSKHLRHCNSQTFDFTC